MARMAGVVAAHPPVPRLPRSAGAPGAARRLPQLMPVALVIAATVLCIGTRDLFNPELSVWTYVWIGLGLMLFRGWWERWGVHGRTTAVPGFALHSLACLVLCALNPLYGFYAFVGYFDAVRVFRWPVLWLGVVAVAMSTGLSQAGGWRGAWGAPWLYLLLIDQPNRPSPSSSGSVGADVPEGGVRPRCSQASAEAARPRGVRTRKPSRTR